MGKVPIVGFHMCGFALEPAKQFGTGRSEHFVDAMDLVELTGAIEERKLGNHLKKDTAVTPDIHFGVVVAVSHEAFRSAVPPGGDVFSIGMLAVNT
jgi:hypothetical protein